MERYRTKRKENGKIIKIYNGKEKYPRIQLSKNGKHEDRRVHRLVLEYFVGPCLSGKEACHNDGNLKNYFIENLRWDTRSNNHYDKIKHGTMYTGNHVGIKNGRAKLNEPQIKVIKRLLEDNYLTIKEIAKIFNVGIHIIYNIKYKKSWRHIK